VLVSSATLSKPSSNSKSFPPLSSRVQLTPHDCARIASLQTSWFNETKLVSAEMDARIVSNLMGMTTKIK